ncbi:MAG TPA: hypothetical protein VJV22_13930 [Acidobacteriaceae bacterium]|nr:hypothetical protein [Acidobacteriaceae bacterium]
MRATAQWLELAGTAIYGTKRGRLGMTWASKLPKWREYFDVIKKAQIFGKVA